MKKRGLYEVLIVLRIRNPCCGALCKNFHKGISQCIFTEGISQRIFTKEFRNAFLPKEFYKGILQNKF